MGSNRTFMELKYLFHTAYSTCLHRSNRTFMELKWELLSRTSSAVLKF